MLCTIPNLWESLIFNRNACSIHPCSEYFISTTLCLTHLYTVQQEQSAHKEVNVGQIIKRTNHEEKLKQNSLLYTLLRKKATLFAFQAPKAGNKQQFLERDMLNTLPVGYSRAKQLCEIPRSVFGDAENGFFLTIYNPDTSLLD